MSKTSFNIAEQKTKVINFIKKHKNILSLDDGHTAITAEFIGKLAKSNNKEFFRLATDIKINARCNFYIFCDNFDKKHHMIEIWLPTVFSKFASDEAIKQFCSCNSFDDVIVTRCGWFNMTPKRWETFEAIFDFYDKPKTSSKKTTNTADKAKALTLNDFKLFMNDIVFID